jgi:hypothetical protein
MFHLDEVFDMMYNGIPIEKEKIKILNMPIYNNIWKKEIANYTINANV